MGVEYKCADKIAHITVEGRTELNLAAPDTVYLPFYDALVRLEKDESAWCALVTAAGDKAFSAGGDLEAYARMEEGYGRETTAAVAGTSPRRSLHTLLKGGVKVTKPMIFAIDGLCLASAFTICMSYADVIFATPESKFGDPSLQRGFSGGSGSQKQRFLPWMIAMELALTGEPLDADTAFRHGLVNHIVPRGQLIQEATKKADEFVYMSPLHVRRNKELVLADRRLSLLASEELERFAGAGIPYDHPDTREGILSFTEKRRPNWTGTKRRKVTGPGTFDAST